VGSCENCDAVGISGGDALIFVRVNQVLVRLWACLLACLTGCAAPSGVAASEQGARSDDDCCVLSESDPFCMGSFLVSAIVAGDPCGHRRTSVDH
jgi:hypothetical protein